MNTVTGDGEPVLMKAVKRGHDGCVKELMEAGADVNTCWGWRISIDDSSEARS